MDKDNLKYTQNKVNDPLAQPHDSNERVGIYKPIAALFFWAFSHTNVLYVVSPESQTIL